MSLSSFLGLISYHSLLRWCHIDNGTPKPSYKWCRVLLKVSGEARARGHAQNVDPNVRRGKFLGDDNILENLSARPPFMEILSAEFSERVDVPPFMARIQVVKKGRDPTSSEIYLHAHTHGNYGKSFVGEKF
ncbi:uncharacterized protein LOC107772097 [Nicotiana tabacum]|uniref:Uncharacterized protein n=3 Tax=Nicotiana TaxID=4085 RepID=A0A1S3Y4H8_TOBAC|nr:PREDICTED: uncharacterized protein LOC104245739 [Nicotiana sylvestris]XP_016447070.1 PREDICTED: uncharacterized protein LOC107772097 [Nicotiana tabacum]